MAHRNIIKISVLEGAFVIREHLHRFPSLTIDDAIRQLRSGPAHSSSYDFQSAASLLNELGHAAFPLATPGTYDFRTALFAAALHSRPIWAVASLYGRKRVLQLANSNDRQCLDAARLLDNPLTDECMEWWDRLSCAFRAESDEAKLRAGREAEKLTLAHERERLKREFGAGTEPRWMAPEENGLGYDIASLLKDKEGNIRELLIEVKGAYTSDVEFFVSQKEWKVCCMTSKQYLFYVWELPIRKLTILDKNDVAPHIAKNQGQGVWTSTKLSLRGIGKK